MTSGRWIGLAYLFAGASWLGIAAFVLAGGLNGKLYDPLSDDLMNGVHIAALAMVPVGVLCLTRAKFDWLATKIIAFLAGWSWGLGAVLPIWATSTEPNPFNIFYFQAAAGVLTTLLGAVDLYRAYRTYRARSRI